MNELRSILRDQVTRLLDDRATKEVLNAAEDGVWPTELWRLLRENGLTRVLVPEDRGGVGGTWADAHVVLRASGWRVAPVPLAETILANWLLAAAGLPIPDEPLTVAPVRADERLSLRRADGVWRLDGTASRVPYARQAGRIVALAHGPDGPRVVAVDPAAAEIEADSNIALEPRDNVRFAGAAVPDSAPAPTAWPSDLVFQRGALLRASQIAGALQSVLDQAVRYAGERVQFGRPIGRFQAVQQSLAVLAGHVAAANAAAASACAALDTGGGDFEIAVAKARASEAAGAAYWIVHQVHGAIGFTYEHPLHFTSRRLMSWRAEFGGESYWTERIGRAVAGRGAECLWPDLSARQPLIAQESNA